MADGLLSLGGSIVNGVISAQAAKKQRKWEEQMQQQQMDWNERMMDKENQFNLNMWNMQNAYNDPSAQYQRMLNSGYNPLFYGPEGAGNASSLDSAQALGYERASNVQNPLVAGLNAFTGTLSLAKDLELKNAQISDLQAGIAKKNEETQSVVAQREKTLAEIDEVKARTDNYLANTDLTKAQRDRALKDLDWLDRLNEATVAEKETNARLNESQKKRIDDLLEGEKLIQVKTMQDFDEKWSKIHAEIAKIAGENALLAQDLENYALNHANNGFMGTGLSIPNLIRSGWLAGSKDKDTQKFEADAMANIVGNKY